MAQLNRSVACLRIAGDDLVPEEITRLMGTKPDLTRTKGQVFYTPAGKSVIARTGQWHLNASEAEPEDLDGQVAQILGKLTYNLSIWENVSTRFEVDLFCGWFLKDENEGVSISPATLAALGERGIILDIDIYAPDADTGNLAR